MRALPFRHRHAHVLSCAALAACAAVAVAAQSTTLPNAPGVWKPWHGLTAIASARADAGVTTAQVKAFEAELLALHALARRAEGVATPVGFSVETHGHLSGQRTPEHAPGYPGPKALPMSGGFSFAAFPIFEYQRNGQTIREDTGETAVQQFLINDLGRAVFDERHIADFGAIDHDAFMKPAPGAAIAGLPRYGDTLVVARDPEALWTPLTLAAALDIVVAQRRTAVAAAQGTMDAFLANLAKVRDPARRAARLRDAREAAANLPDPAAFLASIDQALAIEEATIVAELQPDGGSAKGLDESTRALEDATGWLAGLSAEERTAPACWADGGSALRARLRVAPSGKCVPLVRPNYAYFAKGVPRSALQVIVITGIRRCFDTADRFNLAANAPSPAGCAANRQLIETIDTDALRALLR